MYGKPAGSWPTGSTTTCLASDVGNQLRSACILDRRDTPSGTSRSSESRNSTSRHPRTLEEPKKRHGNIYSKQLTRTDLITSNTDNSRRCIISYRPTSAHSLVLSLFDYFYFILVPFSILLFILAPLYIF